MWSFSLVAADGICLCFLGLIGLSGKAICEHLAAGHSWLVYVTRVCPEESEVAMQGNL